MAKPLIWATIAKTLQSDIALGHYPEGAKLPTEAILAERFGVNRHTVRRAIAALADQGILHTRRGSGVFVVQRPTDYPIGKRVRFHQNIAATGKLAGKQRLRIEIRRSDRVEAGALGLGVGDPVLVYEGLSLSGSAILAHFVSIFSVSRFPDLATAFEATSSVTSALRMCGVDDYLRRETRITAELADATLALHLRMHQGDPVLRTVGINTDVDGTPIEYGITYFAANKVALTVA
jgi:GntR family phosphonate transport system transcriptional regulator